MTDNLKNIYQQISEMYPGATRVQITVKPREISADVSYEKYYDYGELLSDE